MVEASDGGPTGTVWLHGGGDFLDFDLAAGPGHVTLQTLPFSRTARRVLAAAGGGRDESGSGGILGGILGE